jgi:hypothetical protein
LWIDPDPNSQLMLIQLLGYLRSRGRRAFRLDPGPGERRDRQLSFG